MHAYQNDCCFIIIGWPFSQKSGTHLPEIYMDILICDGLEVCASLEGENVDEVRWDMSVAKGVNDGNDACISVSILTVGCVSSFTVDEKPIDAVSEDDRPLFALGCDSLNLSVWYRQKGGKGRWWSIDDDEDTTAELWGMSMKD